MTAPAFFLSLICAAQLPTGGEGSFRLDVAERTVVVTVPGETFRLTRGVPTGRDDMLSASMRLPEGGATSIIVKWDGSFEQMFRYPGEPFLFVYGQCR